MEFVQSFARSQTMQMGGQLLQSLEILGMSSNDLSEHLREKADSNPYIAYKPPAAFVPRGGEDYDALAAVAADKPSLISHVVDQIERSFDNASERMIALHFAEALEPTGWLGQSVETISLMAGCALGRAEQVLSVLQQFEPAGLFARSLSDCLLIQAREADILTWEVEALITNLDLVSEKRFKELAELCDCDPSDIPDILAQIRGLNPKPGMAYSHVPTPVFPPDLIAKRGKDGWTVELNKATSLTITVQEEDGPGDSVENLEARKLRRKALAEARALSQALERRGDTLLRTAAVLVARQSQFLDKGQAFLAPLTLEDVAAELGVHPSTISRSVSGRMIQTPTRALPLRVFFARSVAAVGGAVSRDSAMNFVQKVVAEEDPEAPLSDDAIVTLARRSGMRIARRTVAKYRVALGLGSSYQRRRQAMTA